MDIRSIRTAGLGDATYLLIHDGIGVLVDPQRDVDRFLEAAAEADVTLRWVLETHVHNDYVSGGRPAADRSGAELVLPAGAGVAYPHTPAFHHEVLTHGDLSIRPLHTPGHTPEHISYLVLLDGEPQAVFTGGSLLVAGAGRTDLLGKDRARQLARLQHGSLQRLASLPDPVGVYPTHGEGSFCTASGADRTTSTIGKEKAENAALRHADAEAFADDQLGGLQPYPDYYAHMAAINLAGPAPLEEPAVPDLTPDQVRTALAEGARLLDLRQRKAFADGHIPGALGIEHSDQFGVWAGWLLPFDAPVVLVADAGEDDGTIVDAAVQLARIGFDDVRGVLRGVDGWKAQGGELRSFRIVGLEDFTRTAQASPGQVLDVRAPNERESEHVEGSAHRYVPDLRAGLPAGISTAEPVWIGCASGFRATIAAGLVEQHGGEPVVLTGGGIPDVVELLAREG